MADLGCGVTCLKYVMFFINFVFWITGVAMMGLGTWIAVDESSLDRLAGIAESPMDDALFATAVYVVIGVGGFIFLLGFLGCCGACCNKPRMLCVYAFLVGIVLAVELVGGILVVVFWDTIDDKISDEMKQTLLKHYGVTEISTKGWDSLQQDFKCCGVESPKDYLNSAWYKDVPVPVSCCAQQTPSDIVVCREEAKRSEGGNSTILFGDGCYDELKGWIDSNAVILIAVIFTFLALQVFGLIFACVLRSAMTKADGGVV